MIEPDIYQVLEIEAELYSDPLTEYDLRELLRQRNTAAHVAEDLYGDVAGFIIFDVAPICYKIVRLSISLQSIRNGHGTALIDKLKQKLTHRRHSIGIQVQERSLAMQLFLRAQGFHYVGTRPEAGNDGDDIYLFEFTRKS